MKPDNSEEDSRCSNHRKTMKGMNGGGITKPSCGRFQRNTVCQVKQSSFRRKMNVWNQSSARGKVTSRTELQLLRLSRNNFPVSERMKGASCLNGSVGHGGPCNSVSSSQCDNDRNNAMSLRPHKKSCEIIADWGRRTELHNIFNVKDGDKVWNIIRRGLFAEIKLWKNEYGSISCKATGKISVKGIPEKSFIEISTKDNLRKLLSLSHMQWSALCEALDEKNMTLKFNAFQVVDINKMSSLEKLWFFICKRRHFLPNLCIMGKLSGAVKVMKQLEIIPKIIVTEIRDFKGEEIS